jgi:cysteine desulfurase/selenocysteine lyase
VTLGEACRSDFHPRPTVNGRPLVHLDSGASSQKPRSVLEAMQRYYERSHANVHRSIHTLGEEATEQYEAARDAVRSFVAAVIGKKLSSRGDHRRVNIIAATIGRTWPGDEVIVSEMEHHSNLVPWQMACRDRGATLRAIPLQDGAYLDMDAYARLLGPRTRLVAVTHISNVLGTINPVAEIVQRAKAAGALVLLDGAQAAPHLRLTSPRWAATYVFSGHKMLGPTGMACSTAAARRSSRLSRGWGQRDDQKCGSTTPSGTISWRLAAPRPSQRRGCTPPSTISRSSGWTASAPMSVTHAALPDALTAIPGVTVYGPRSRDQGRWWRSTWRAFTPDGAALLDQAGVAVRAGHHCAQPLARALGITGTLRASFSVYNTAADVERLAEAVAGLRDQL